MKRTVVAATCAGVLAVTVALLPAWGQEGATGESMVCADCHAEVVAEFRHSPHVRVEGFGLDVASCESCHGPSMEHAETGDPDLIKALSEMAPPDASETCYECHKLQQGQQHFSSSMHEFSEVSCTSCHDPHGTREAMVRGTPTELCSSCHQSVAAQFDLPRSHPSMGDNDCVICHDPHGTKNPRSMREFGNYTCGECHIDKTAPHVFPHDVSMVDGCEACHEVHGSTNRHLLKHDRQNNLCYECHPAAHTPGFHSFPRFLEEKCTACHTAIHGSNVNPYFLEE
jgi:DmsE family decaheme c-type cytochrome